MELEPLSSARRYWYLQPKVIGRITESVKKHQRHLDEIDTLVELGHDKHEVHERYFKPDPPNWLDEMMFDNRVKMWKNGELDAHYESLHALDPKRYPLVPDHCFDKPRGTGD